MSNKTIKLYVMKVGQINLLDKAHMTPGRGHNHAISMPGYCYLIDHPKGLVLVDTGMANDNISTVKDEQIVVNQLFQLGYKPDDVEYVIMTHLHLDHAKHMTDFPNSTFVLRKEELKAAWWPEKCESGYIYDQYKDTRQYEYIQLKDNVDFDLFCDGRVVLIDTKGHTRGHQSVIVKLENFGKVLLVSDAASLRENLDDMILPGVCSNNWYAMESLEKLKHLEKEGHTLFFGHDVEQGKLLKLLPEYYD